MKVTIAILNPDRIGGDTAISLATMTSTLKCELYLMSIQTAIVSQGRNQALKAAKDNSSDYLMFIDADIVFPANAFNHMVELNEDIVTGIYHQGHQQNFRPCIYRFTEDGQVENLVIYPKDKPFKIDCAGAGLLLISKKVIDAMPDNAFDHMDLPNVGQIYEDLSFFHRVKNKGFEVWATPLLRLGHTKMQTIYPEFWDAYLQQMRNNLDQAEGINGWTTEEELYWLAVHAKEMKSVVEIGSHKGRSAEVLLKNCQGDVYCVDLWDGLVEMQGKRHPVFDGEELYKEFLNNVKGYKNLKVMRGDSIEMAKKFNGNLVDMTFIDAGHDYKSVKADIEAWLPKTRKIIAGHDYALEWPGVVQAVNEKFGNKVKTLESIWWVELEGEKRC